MLSASERASGVGNHFVAAPFEQRVVQQLPQPAERMTDRRLGQVQSTACRSDAAFAIDGVEDGEQVEVDPG